MAKKNPVFIRIAAVGGAVVALLTSLGILKSNKRKDDDVLPRPSISEESPEEKYKIIIYEVKGGEWLEKIAKDHNTTVETILKANDGMMPDFYIDSETAHIEPGQKIRIPIPTASEETQSNQDEPPSNTKTTYTEYAYKKYGVTKTTDVTIEKSTDTLYDIAEEYHTDVKTIVDMNADKYPGLRKNPSIIEKGMKLIVPDNRPEAEITENNNVPTSNAMAEEDNNTSFGYTVEDYRVSNEHTQSRRGK